MNLNYRVDKTGLFGSCTSDQLLDTAPLLLGYFVSGSIVEERKIEKIDLYFMNVNHREIARHIIYNRCYNNKLK